MLKVLSYILCDLDPKVKVIGQKAGICDGVPSTSALVSILFMYFFCQGSHTEAAYSTKGRTYVLYADSFSLGLLVWMLRLMNLSYWFSL